MVTVLPESKESDGISLVDVQLSHRSEGQEKDTSLSAIAPPNVFTLRNSGYLMQYFSVGLIYGGLPATAYGFFLGYLAVPAHVYATVKVILVLPWSFKFAFGALHPGLPLPFHSGSYAKGLCRVLRVLRRRLRVPCGWQVC